MSRDPYSVARRSALPAIVKVYPEPDPEAREAFRRALEQLGTDRVIVLPLAADASRVDLEWEPPQTRYWRRRLEHLRRLSNRAARRT